MPVLAAVAIAMHAAPSMGWANVQEETDPPLTGLRCPSLVPKGAFSVDIECSKPVTGLQVHELELLHSTAGNLTGSGASYTLWITPADVYGAGTDLLRVLGDVAVDVYGNGNGPCLQCVLGIPDATPAVADASAVEADAMAFTVTLNRKVFQGLKPTPSFTDGTAMKGTDYTENTAALTFAGLRARRGPSGGRPSRTQSAESTTSRSASDWTSRERRRR